MKIVSIAILGKKNNPLYVYVTNEENKRKFEYIIHTSLDFFEEKVPLISPISKKSTQNQNDMYLGHLFPTEDYKVYGYLTNTNYKLVCIIDDSEIKEQEMKTLLNNLHTILVDAICNPFYITDEPITSKIFHLKILDLIGKK
ncbi:trafficking protein particle complex subunit 2-like protein [Anaeramoeba flamelloides]|uniref:Trafficking protein particle complex subunit 2-like protein n=1 Tax=Anaeramoeba flamelloides TaxID=1746091 RepID=A0AAV7YEA7_9EUKA|nr:trafficking protein particle complex subunit 2-like protein [Anaeramoeba flamelloides]KAJ6243213.1 trafficking protein particle complex subunit 2-like protein [Anaeramoeba flamelloides]